MKKTIFFILAVTFATTGIFAQSSSNAGTTTAARKAPQSIAEKTDKAADKIANEAKLTPDQRNKIHEVLYDYFSKVAQIKKADNKQNSPATSAKLSDLKNEEYTKFGAILTASQMNTVKAMDSATENSK